MKCPQCDSEESQKEQRFGENPNIEELKCLSCGAPLNIEEDTTACKCSYCGTYHVIEMRLNGERRPHVVLPFRITKDEAIESIAKSVGKRTYAPDDFLSKKTIEKMEGRYVPFWLYDFELDVVYNAVGTKVRTWRSGDYVYTEKSYFDIYRKMDFDYNKIPADASEIMEDDVMDLLEPYNYSDLYDFKEEYMSGFLGTTYNYTGDELEPRAQEKAKSSAHSLVTATVHGYSAVTREMEDYVYKNEVRSYALLPVWIYDYEYRGEKFSYHVNGQNGKVIGVAPIDKRRAISYSVVFATLATGIAAFLYMIMGVI